VRGPSGSRCGPKSKAAFSNDIALLLREVGETEQRTGKSSDPRAALRERAENQGYAAKRLVRPNSGQAGKLRARKASASMVKPMMKPYTQIDSTM
jgi:hypothetical protein